MRNHLAKVALVAFVLAIAAVPVWATSGQQAQGTTQEQEIEQQIQAAIAKAMEELQAELAELREQLAAISEGRMARFEMIEPRIEAAIVDRERSREMAERAREMARQATENFRYNFEFEPFAGNLMALHRTGGAYGEAVIDHAEELGLSETQQEQIAELQRAHERAAIDRRADIEVAEMDVQALDEDPDADIAAVRSALETLMALRIDGQIADRELHRDVRNVLTEEQREQFDEIWGQHVRPMRIAISRSR